MKILFKSHARELINAVKNLTCSLCRDFEQSENPEDVAFAVCRLHAAVGRWLD